MLFVEFTSLKIRHYFFSLLEILALSRSSVFVPKPASTSSWNSTMWSLKKRKRRETEFFFKKMLFKKTFSLFILSFYLENVQRKWKGKCREARGSSIQKAQDSFTASGFSRPTTVRVISRLLPARDSYGL